jgi:hypothetical protein
MTLGVNEDFQLRRHLIGRIMNAMKFLLPALFCAACSQDRVMDELTSTTITNSGGTALSADGKLRLLIPSGALSSPTTITIRNPRDSLQYASRVYELEPHGLQFARAISLEISKLSGDHVAIAHIKDGQKHLLETSYDPRTGVAAAHLDHFSSYAAVTISDPCAALTCGDPCTWCDPADPACVEPPFAKVCNHLGFCLPAVAPPMCNTPMPDAGVLDGGEASPDAEPNVLANNDDANGTYCSELSVVLSSGGYDLLVRHFNATRTIVNYYVDLGL